jgi:hypothetical protein
MPPGSCPFGSSPQVFIPVAVYKYWWELEALYQESTSGFLQLLPVYLLGSWRHVADTMLSLCKALLGLPASEVEIQAKVWRVTALQKENLHTSAQILCCEQAVHFLLRYCFSLVGFPLLCRRFIKNKQTNERKIRSLGDGIGSRLTLRVVLNPSCWSPASSTQISSVSMNFFSGGGRLLIRLAWNSVCSLGWPWTCNPLASALSTRSTGMHHYVGLERDFNVA